MSTDQVIAMQLRVTKVRSRGSFGGVIFNGKDDLGAVHVVKADFMIVPDAALVEVAQMWRVTGKTEEATYTRDGVVKTEIQILPTQLDLLRPSGANLVNWIAQSPDCKGIGEVRARRLFERFGVELVPLIEAGEANQIAEVIDIEAAESLIAAFAKHGLAETLTWMDQLGLPRPLGSSVARYWGREAPAKVEANPYVLISFCADWKVVDGLARLRFGVRDDDPRRLVAAAEDTLYRSMSSGSTAMTIAEATSRISRLLGGAGLAREALAAAVADSKLIEDGNLVQAAGLSYIENFVVRSASAMLEGAALDQGEMFEVELPSRALVVEHLKAYEAIHGIDLTPEQRAAVATSATHRFSLILGGAGTGKTTVLKALCHVLEQVSPGAEIHQFALAGRAAQRMSQSTGRPAATIAAFLNGMEVAPGATVLIDEVSMVDVLLMYRVLKDLPPGVRIVLIGDPAQLPPIGPGLVLHAMEGLAAIPQTTLKTVKRQSSASGIPQVARAVRGHESPRWASYGGLGMGVSAVACDEAKLDETVARVYEEMGGTGTSFDVQILSTTKNGPGGVKNLNALIHERFAPKMKPVQSLLPGFGVVNERSEDGLSLFAGDLVIFGANDYTLGLRNGSLGTILHPGAITSVGLSVFSPPMQSSSTVCTVEFEGVKYELTASHLRELRHAYAITTHKSQGSQFDRVIVPVRDGKLLDNALLYTAITRGVNQVVLVGNIAAAERAIRAASHSSRRLTRLNTLLKALAHKRPAAEQDKQPELCLECL